MYKYSFYFINVETTGKYKNVRTISHFEKFTIPPNEFLLHKCRNNKKMQKCTKNTNLKIC